MTSADAIRRIGGDPGRIVDALRSRGAYHSYLELHIEQGGILERDRIPVGMVEGIVWIDRYDVMVTGFANHAGTTPMADRQDALLAAAHLTIAVRETVTTEPARQVGTVGQLDVTPNASNVIPGVVRLTIEFRDSRHLRSSTGSRSRSASRRRDRARHEDIHRFAPTSQRDRHAPEVQRAIERSAGDTVSPRSDCPVAPVTMRR